MNAKNGIPEPNWDEQLAASGGHLYQSRAWAQFQQALGRDVIWQSGNGWSWMAVERSGRLGFNYLYSAYGPTVTSDSSLQPALESLEHEARARQLDFVRCEPMGTVDPNALMQLGARSFRDMQPLWRMTLNLTADEAALRGQIAQSNRNLINQAANRGLEFEISTNPADVTDFLNLQRLTAQRSGWAPHPDSYYRTLVQTLMPGEGCRLYFARHGQQRIAAALSLDFAGTRYYAFAGADPVLNRQFKGSVVLAWWMIMDAKERGLRTFDFGGAAPPDQPDHPWAGHTRFKQSLGAQPVAGGGTWDIPLKTGKYRLYTFLKRFV